MERLAPSHRDPHQFHEAKSEIVHNLRMLAEGVAAFNDGELHDGELQHGRPSWSPGRRMASMPGSPAAGERWPDDASTQQQAMTQSRMRAHGDGTALGSSQR